MKILKDAGILAEETERMEKLEKCLEEFPISSLKNIVPLRGKTDDAIEDKIKKFVVADLTEAFKKETNFRLKSNIAKALRKIDNENWINYSLNGLHSPDLCEKERNEMWMDIFGRSRKNYRNTDIDSFCNAMRAMLQRQIKKTLRVSIFLKELFRQRVLIID